MELSGLARAIAADRDKGYTPFCIVGTAGTVNAGDTDDLGALARLARDEGLLNRNPVYQAVVSQPGALGEYTRMAGELKTLFSDQAIQQMVAELPPEIPASRRQQILETFRFRRDHLSNAVESYVRRATTPLEQLSPVERMRAAGERTTSAAEEFLTRRLLNGPDGRPTTRYPEAIADAYAHLRRTGASATEARQALHHTLTTGTSVLPAGTINLLDGVIARVEPTLSIPQPAAPPRRAASESFSRRSPAEQRKVTGPTVEPAERLVETSHVGVRVSRRGGKKRDGGRGDLACSRM